jgi:site-specific DNA-methyltransferase (adenine-specific)
MRDQMTFDREAELTAPTRIASGDGLDPKIVNADCLIEMPTMPAQSVDAIISDLPYGTTACKWDSVIPFAPLWAEWKRLLKPNGAIVLTASQPFTSALVMSNPLWFRCEWIWDKVNAANFAIANKQPLKCHESVLVFGEGQTTYNPQKVTGAKNHAQGRSATNTAETRGTINRVADDLSGMKFPKSIQTFAKHSSQCGLHPTQKPTELMRYLIRTYTNPGDVVLDPCCGSGTTCLAAWMEGRQSIGIEKDEQYAKIAINRIHEARGLGV